MNFFFKKIHLLYLVHDLELNNGLKKKLNNRKKGWKEKNHERGEEKR